MNKKCKNQIVEILLQRPKGMKLSVIVRNLYNLNSGLFEDYDLYETLYNTTKQYLYRESRKKESIFKHVNDKWGYYAIKPHYARQLKFKFKK